ncbi:MAG: hypothetical protein E6K13_05695 [Methanobacteriota archaeon]|nr:MAG: hypothetical protein E6K13_05695 [Euryarchaeota archaeon]
MALKTIHKDYSDPLVQKSLYRVLRENVLCSMSTVSTGHRAYVNTAYFCHSPQLELFFLSDPESFHCRNLAQNPSMAIAVFRSDQTWGHPDRGVQLFGICREARGSVAERAGRLYSSRFPPFSKLLSGTSAVARKQARLLLSYRFYRFVANRVKILDEREFGGGVFVLTNVPRSAQPVRER